MKKVFYSIGLVTAMLFTACSSDDRTTASEAVETNTEESMNSDAMNDLEQPATASTDNTDVSYQQHAQMVTDEMKRDLKLDDATATEVTRIYETRYRELDGLEQNGVSYSETERMGGQTNETDNATSGTTGGTTGSNEMGNNTGTSTMGNNTETGNTNQFDTDRRRIDETTDRELKAVLTPEQYRKYEQNRDRYNNMQMNNTNNSTTTGTTDRGTTGSTTDRGTSTGTTSGTGTTTGTQRPTGGNQ